MTDDAAASALSSDQSAELHRWCEVLTGIGAAWSATAGQLRDMPALNCPARREDALLAAAHPDWHPHEAFHAGLDAVGLIDAAARHVSGLRSLVADHNLVLTPWPLARAVVEHIAHAGWLLDPAITAEQRVARRWMAKLANAYRYRWFASAVHAAKTDVEAIKRGRDQVRAELARRFPDTDLDWSLEQDSNGPPWVVAGQRYPGLAEATRRFTKYGGVPGVPGLYALLSLIVHPNLHTALASILEPVQHDGFIQYSYRVDVEQTIRLLRLAAAFLYRAGMVVCSFFQLDDTALEAWAESSLPADSSDSEVDVRGVGQSPQS